MSAVFLFTRTHVERIGYMAKLRYAGRLLVIVIYCSCVGGMGFIAYCESVYPSSNLNAGGISVVAIAAAFLGMSVFNFNSPRHTSRGWTHG